MRQLYIHLFVFRFHSYMVITENLVEFPVVYCGFVLAVYFICSSVYMSIPVSQLISPLPHFHFSNNNFFLHLWLHFCFENKFICTIFLDSTYRWYHMICLCLFDVFHSLWQFQGPSLSLKKGIVLILSLSIPPLMDIKFSSGYCSTTKN